MRKPELSYYYQVCAWRSIGILDDSFGESENPKRQHVGDVHVVLLDGSPRDKFLSPRWCKLKTDKHGRSYIDITVDGFKQTCYMSEFHHICMNH